MEEVSAFFEGMESDGELSDEDLDMVAGGKNAGKGFFGSAICLYIGCGILSIVGAADGEGCGHMLERIGK